MLNQNRVLHHLSTDPKNYKVSIFVRLKVYDEIKRMFKCRVSRCCKSAEGIHNQNSVLKKNQGRMFEIGG